MSDAAALQSAVLRFLETGEGTFESLACAIYAWQHRENAPYRRFCERRGVSGELDDWTRIPVVPQAAFKVSRLATFPVEETIREFRTSGTTGEGYGSHFFRDLTLYDNAIRAGWNQLNLGHLPKFVLAPSPEEAPHSSLSYMMGQLATRFYLRNGQLQASSLRRDLAETNGPVLLLGTALAFFNLIEKSASPLPLPPGSRLLETGGYKGSGRTLTKADFYEQLGQFFGLEPDAIHNEYGMTELSSQFYTYGLGRVHRAGPWLRARIVHPLTGTEVALEETGVVQLFDLANVGSVLAIQTEDLAVRQADGFLLLGRDPTAVARGCSRSADDILNH
jgi:hypothetical protein